MNFDWKGFKEEEFVVHCNTEEKVINFLNECENQGLNVLDSMKSGGSAFFEYGENTCYRVDMQCSVHYGSKGCYERKGHKVVKWQKQGQRKTISNILENIQEGEIYRAFGGRYIKFIDSKITIGVDDSYTLFFPTELFSKMKEVEFVEAIEFMKQGGVAVCLANYEDYKIVDGQIRYREISDYEVKLNLKQIESKWLIEE